MDQTQPITRLDLTHYNPEIFFLYSERNQKLKSVTLCSDPPNFASHNANLNVKKGYIMVPRELRWCHRCWLIRSHCLCSKRAYIIVSQLPPRCGIWMCSFCGKICIVADEVWWIRKKYPTCKPPIALWVQKKKFIFYFKIMIPEQENNIFDSIINLFCNRDSQTWQMKLLISCTFHCVEAAWICHMKDNNLLVQISERITSILQTRVRNCAFLGRQCD